MANTCSETWLTVWGAVKSIEAIWKAPKKMPYRSSRDPAHDDPDCQSRDWIRVPPMRSGME
jgi:hypothetical protein